MRGTKVKGGFMLSVMKNAQNETKKKYILHTVEYRLIKRRLANG